LIGFAGLADYPHLLSSLSVIEQGIGFSTLALGLAVGLPAAAAQAFAVHQREKGREAEVVVYPGAGHAFFNDTRADVYREDAAKDAWARTLDLFGRHLS